MKVLDTKEGAIAHINISELHDYFAGSFQYDENQCETDPSGGSIQEFKLVRDYDKYPDFTEADWTEADKVVAQLNLVVHIMRTLDSQFHDLFDCR